MKRSTLNRLGLVAGLLSLGTSFALASNVTADGASTPAPGQKLQASGEQKFYFCDGFIYYKDYQGKTCAQGHTETVLAESKEEAREAAQAEAEAFGTRMWGDRFVKAVIGSVR